MEALIDHSLIDKITLHFQALTSMVPLHPIHNEAEYDSAVSALNHLLDAGAANEQDPLADLANTLGILISAYDDTHYPQSAISPSAMLGFLMDQHNITQSQLPEVGTQGVVSEILNGKRALNLRQIKALAARFHVPASVFI